MPEPVAISAEARAAAADGPMPLTDAAAHAAAVAAAKPDGLPQRHPAAGRRFDDAPNPERVLAEAERIMGNQAETISDLRQQLADARARIAAYEAAERDGSCPGCHGHQRTIAEMCKSTGALRGRVAELDRTLRAIATLLEHVQAHRELEAEAAGSASG